MSLRYPKLLRQLRTEAHKSQAELAEVLGTSQTMYARYERGANALPLRHLLTRPTSPSLRWAVMKRRILRTSATMPLSSWRSFTA